MSQNEDRCWNYDACKNKWIANNATINEKRKNAAGRVLPVLGQGRERPWILGGEVPGVSSNNASSSTEYYTGHKWIISEDDDLQEEKFGTCATNINITSNGSDEIVLIGGKKTFRQVESFRPKTTSIQALKIKSKTDGKNCLWPLLRSFNDIIGSRHSYLISLNYIADQENVILTLIHFNYNKK